MKNIKKRGIKFLAFSVLLVPLEASASSLVSSFTEGLFIKGTRRAHSVINSSYNHFYQDRKYASHTKSPLTKERVSGQVYGIATYDALFKYVLSHETITPSFLKTFAPDLPDILSVERLDEHMNPVQKHQNARDFLQKKETKKTVLELAQLDKVQVSHLDPPSRKITPHSGGTELLTNFLTHFNDIRHIFPKERYDGTMDFLCYLESGGYAMVEMQVAPQDYWDERALAYAANVYSKQLSKGDQWLSGLKNVTAINILGGGKDGKVHWPGTNQFRRVYRFQEQLHQKSDVPRFIRGIELYQYSLMNAPKEFSNQVLQDWVIFLKAGHLMTQKEVEEQIKTPEVLEAFELAKIQSLPSKVRLAYTEEDKEYAQYSQHTQDLVQEGLEKGREEGKRAIALGMLSDNLPIANIAKYTGLSEAEIQDLKRD